MNQQPSTFTWPLARKLASYCAQAYDRDDITDVATDAAAIVTLDGNDDIIVAFRGSRAARDFVQDAKVRFTTLVEAGAPSLCPASSQTSAFWLVGPADQRVGAPVTERVHEGFLQDFEAIDLAVTSNVKTLLAARPASRVYVTGHSLGGALAILCAYQFAKQQLPIAGVYTFGQPRVGNADFAKAYDATGAPSLCSAGIITSPRTSVKASGVDSSALADQKVGAPIELRTSDSALRTLHDLTFRVVNQNDLVPRIPGWLMGYRHCGQEIFLRPDGRAEVNPTLIEKLLWDAAGLYRAYRHGEEALIREHFINAYQETINHQLSTCDEFHA